MRKSWGFIAALLIFACVLTVGALAASGWQQQGSCWFYYDADGAAHNGWLLDAGRWYYCAGGRAYADGIFEIDGISYGFTPGGSMATGWYRDGDGRWYRFDGSGRMQTGWIADRGSWYYCSPSTGRMISGGFCEIDGKMYCFDADGRMVIGWYLCDDGWHYFDDNGRGHEGWLSYGGSWYYLQDGRMTADCAQYIPTADGSGTVYYFGADGRMLANAWRAGPSLKLKDTDTWFYYGEDGKAYNGWLYYNGYWYWCENGEMAVGAWPVNGKIRYFDQNGHWLR